jgi:hypothetical protein
VRRFPAYSINHQNTLFRGLSRNIHQVLNEYASRDRLRGYTYVCTCMSVYVGIPAHSGETSVAGVQTLTVVCVAQVAVIDRRSLRSVCKMDAHGMPITKVPGPLLLLC